MTGKKSSQAAWYPVQQIVALLVGAFLDTRRRSQQVGRAVADRVTGRKGATAVSALAHWPWVPWTGAHDCSGL
jgi:hypothetical protein